VGQAFAFGGKRARSARPYTPVTDETEADHRRDGGDFLKPQHLAGLVCMILALIGTAAAGTTQSVSGDDFTSAKRATLEVLRARGLDSTGLRPVYPTAHSCPEIGSPFAATTRADGSRRNSRFFHGLHSGADIYVPEGTPILAIAAGEVVNKYRGYGIGGIDLILRHSPDDTGRAEWIYSSYKHLKALPTHAIGQRLERVLLIRNRSRPRRRPAGRPSGAPAQARTIGPLPRATWSWSDSKKT
jgi:hypothetical protein